MSHLNRWLIRLSYSFLILAGLLAWKTHKQVQASGWSGEAVLMVIGAVLAAGLGLWGVRARHRGLVQEGERAERIDER